MEAKKATTVKRVENFIMIVLEKYTVVEFDESVKLNFVSTILYNIYLVLYDIVLFE